MDEAGARSARSGELVVAAGREAIRAFGKASASWRPDPDFLVIGAKRGGSTSFYFDLLAHRHLCPLFPRPERLPKAEATKGIHYFDQNYFRGERWYRSHLPSARVRARQQARVGGPVVTGEASPYYLFHPGAAERAAALLPDVKIIAVLRDPVMRSYSHWKERRRNGAETLSFPDALAAEDERIGDVEDALRRDPAFRSYAHENLSYARQSEYDTALQEWFSRYPAQRILVLASEDYYRDPQSCLDRALQFLGLPGQHIATGAVRNAAGGERLDASVRAQLAARFAPHNHRLEQLTGRTFPWQ